MAIVPIVLLGTLVFTAVNFLKFLAARAWRPAVTQALAWGCGVAAVFVMGATAFASGIMIGSQSLDALPGWSKVLVGVLAASMISALNEVKKAIDRRDSARMPEWFMQEEPRPAAAAPEVHVPAEWTEEVHHRMQ